MKKIVIAAVAAMSMSLPVIAQESADVAKWLHPEDGVIVASQHVYEARGRRDPFVSYRDPKSNGPRLAGVRGMMIAELDLQGIVLSDDGKERMALVLGSDDKGYTVREGDLLHDGRVKEVQADRVIFLRKVDDPLKWREYDEVPVLLEPSGK